MPLHFQQWSRLIQMMKSRLTLSKWSLFASCFSVADAIFIALLSTSTNGKTYEVEYKYEKDTHNQWGIFKISYSPPHPTLHSRKAYTKDKAWPVNQDDTPLRPCLCGPLEKNCPFRRGTGEEETRKNNVCFTVQHVVNVMQLMFFSPLK